MSTTSEKKKKTHKLENFNVLTVTRMKKESQINVLEEKKINNRKFNRAYLQYYEKKNRNVTF